MRHLRLLLSLPVLITALVPHTPAQSASQSAPSRGVYAGAWKTIAPHIQVDFSQLHPNSCTWRFRNADDARTLESMRFSYTYSTLPVSRTPVTRTSITSPTTQSGEDVLPEPLAPLEEAGGQQNYEIPANCATVNMHVIDAKWM